jgi:primase-polymerase (primpol)-like protein
MIYPCAIPPELRERPQWVTWKLETRNGKSTKVPYSVNGDYARVNDPTTWASFDEVLAVGRGIGYVFSADDNFTGIDLDHVRDPATGRTEPSAWDIVRALDSYAEWSVSGAGIHIFIKATVDKGRRKDNVEIYDRSRYFTVTGHHVLGTPDTIEYRQAEVDALVQRMGGEGYRQGIQEDHVSGPVSLDDKGLESVLTKGPNCWTFIDLFYWGHLDRYHGDCSRALAALATIIAKETRDPAQIERMMRASALFKVSEAKRQKWDAPRGMGTWGAQLIEQALAWTKA